MLIPMRLLALAVAAFFSLLTLPINLIAADYTVETKLATNVRKMPGTKHAVVVRVPAKSRLKVLARNESTDIKGKKSWLKVESNDGKVGWVGTWLVKFVKSSTDSMMPMTGGTTPDAGMETPPPADTMAPAPAAPSEAAPAAPEGMENIPDIEILDSVNEADLAK